MTRVRARLSRYAVLSFAVLSCSVPDRRVQVDHPGSAGSAGVAGYPTQRNAGGNAGTASIKPSTAGSGAGGIAATSGGSNTGTAQGTSLGGATTAGGSTGFPNGGTLLTAGATTRGSEIGGSATGGNATGGAGGVTTATTGGVANGGATTGGSATGGVSTGGAATGGSAAWCATQVMPSGVVAADYQCIDFDSGLPPVSTWPRTLTNSGTMQLTTARAASSPNSIAVSVPSADTFQTQGTATATWNVVGANPISRVALWASLSPPQVAGPTPDWTGYVSLLCVAFGYGEACLVYTRGADLIESGVAYTGYALSLMYSGGPAYRNFCAVTGSLTVNIWTRVELRVTKGSSSTVQVFFNGTEAAKCTSTFGDDTVAKFTFGEEASSAMSAWTMHYDNIVAAVSR